LPSSRGRAGSGGLPRRGDEGGQAIHRFHRLRRWTGVARESALLGTLRPLVVPPISPIPPIRFRKGSRRFHRLRRWMGMEARFVGCWRGVGGSGPAGFEQLEAFPDLTALAEGDGGVRRLETWRDPVGRQRFPRDLDHPVCAKDAGWMTTPPIHRRRLRPNETDLRARRTLRAANSGFFRGWSPQVADHESEGGCVGHGHVAIESKGVWRIRVCPRAYS